MAVITISRQTGSGGDEVAAHLSSILGYHLVKRAYLEKVVYEYCLVRTLRQLPLPEIIPPTVDEQGSRLVHRQVLRDVLVNLAARDNLVLVGYGGQVIFRGFDESFHVRIVAPFDDRVRHVCQMRNLEREEASQLIRRKDMERRNFLKDFYGVEIGKQRHYDLILNTARLTFEEGARVIAAAFLAAVGEDADKGEFKRFMEEEGIEPLDVIPEHYQAEEELSESGFAHPSEAEFAAVLNFYRIRWEYEPTSFPIEWDGSGKVVESFRPDFYLPEFQTYVELTTMKQYLVTKKNKKIKRFRELYPDQNLKVFYGKDYKQLLGKYGMD